MVGVRSRLFSGKLMGAMLYLIFISLENYIAFIIAVLSVLAIVVARRALSRGLTRYAIHMAQVSVVMIALLTLWRIIGDRLPLGKEAFKLLEGVEYLGYIVAYTLFISSILFEFKQHKRAVIGASKD